MRFHAKAIVMTAMILVVSNAWAKEEDEEKIPLSAVPQQIKDVAVAAVPGLLLEKAEREMDKGVLVYDLEGTAQGIKYEVEVTAAGKLLEIEKGDDDADDHEDGDDDK